LAARVKKSYNLVAIRCGVVNLLGGRFLGWGFLLILILLCIKADEVRINKLCKSLLNNLQLF